MIRMIDVKTGEETYREYTQKEIDARTPPVIKSLDEREKEFYNANGLTVSVFVDALMQQELEIDSTAMDAYKLSRTITRAKSDFPV